MDQDTHPRRIRFGVFLADLTTGEIRKNGIPLRMQRQPFAVLAALLERPGEMVSREELRKRLWPDGLFVDHERGLNKAVNRLREVLGDDPDHPTFIETLPQRGYRFLTQVDEERPASRTAETIAVLPLENLSADPADEYFSDGMTDELISELAQMTSLHVISRTSVMRYKANGRKSLPEIASELRADVVIEGTVMRSGQKIRVTAQLIQAREDRHLWSQRYERELTDVLELQSDVARAVAREVRATLRPEAQHRPLESRKVNPDAFQAYLQGHYFLHQNLRGTAKALEWFRRSIELDPSFAEAHAGLAQALIFAGIYELCPCAESYAEARTAALKALELDESNASAHNALADVLKGLDWDLPGAVREQRRALALNPSHQLTRLWLAETLSRMELHEEALSESARAVTLDPVSAISHNNRAMLLWRARRFAEAIREAEVALELDPAHLNAFWWKGLALAGLSRYDESVACLQRGWDLTRAPIFGGSLGYVHGLAGATAQAHLFLDHLHAMTQQRYISNVNFAIVYAGLGDADAVFTWLEKACQARDGRVQQLVQPCFDPFRTDARYQALKSRIGLSLFKARSAYQALARTAPARPDEPATPAP
jgi:TolB-like protein/Tfp pilus assembly protein PilF